MAYGSYAECLYASTALGTAKASFTTEVAINDTAGMGVQAKIVKDFWASAPFGAVGRAVRIKAAGILSSTATPTYTFTVRAGAAGSITSAILLGSAALTTGSGVTNQPWELEGVCVLATLGAAGANSSIRGSGFLRSPGIASPFMAGLGANSSLTAPLATTLDTSIDNFINFNVACSASSSSNSIQLHQLIVEALN